MSKKTRTGWVYVLVNESIAGQVKVGFTSGHPEDRAKELHSSGVPTPYKVATAFLFSDKVKQIEQKVHSMLKIYRVSERREFFRCSGLDAADAIKEASNLLNESIVKVDPVLLSRGELKVFKKQAEQGDAEAKCSFGDRYSRGIGVEQNHKEAYKWYAEAAYQGQMRSYLMICKIITSSRREVWDNGELIRWCIKLAKEGSAFGQYLTSYCYYRGNWYLEQDYEKSINWCRRAAEQGYRKAQDHLGFRYANGHGVKKDEIEATKWYSKAAEQGSITAQNYLKTKGLG